MARISLGQNIQSLTAQRGLRGVTASLEKSFERLSSGLRINKAADDAAGLAISSQLDIDRRVSAQGVRNINDAASLLNIADGALSELSNIVTRLTELGTQAANGAFTYQQRLKIDAEAQALGAEYSRISKSMKFNGLSVLGGDVDVLSVQSGYGTTGAISSKIGGAIGTGTFTQRISIQFEATATAPSAPDDLNLDGIPDFTYLDGNNVNVRMGNADGSFGLTQSLTISGTLIGPRVKDFDNDGYADLLVGDTTSDYMQLFRGTASGSFNTTGVSFAIGTANATAPSAEDLNNDGNFDLTFRDPTADIVLIRLGNGDGTFNIRQQMTLTTNNVATTNQDANGDGILDILSIDTTENTVNVYLGNGDGTFRARISTATGLTPLGFGVRQDLNNDGIVDLHIAHNNDHAVSIMLGNGDGTFRAQATYQVGNNPQTVARYDVNSDGQIDLLINDRNDDTISILLGNGDGTFRARTTVATGDNPGGVTTFQDFNGDGAFDIISFGNNDHTLNIHIADTKSGAAMLNTFSLKTRNEALKALPQFREMERLLGIHRGTIGSFQSRLLTANNVTSASGENFAAARSRITDVDIAQESAGLARDRVLQNVSTAILAQANQMPALALKLLQL